MRPRTKFNLNAVYKDGKILEVTKQITISDVRVFVSRFGELDPRLTRDLEKFELVLAGQ